MASRGDVAVIITALPRVDGGRRRAGWRRWREGVNGALVLGDVCLRVPEVVIAGVAVDELLPGLGEGGILRGVARPAGSGGRHGEAIDCRSRARLGQSMGSERGKLWGRGNPRSDEIR